MPEPYWESQPDNQWSYLRNGDKDLHRELYNNLKVRDKDYVWDMRYKAGMWDGWERFFHIDEAKVLTGFVTIAARLGYDYEEKVLAVDPLDDFSEEVQLVDPNTCEGYLTPNGYQKELEMAIRLGRRRGHFDHITAAGKSVEIAIIIQVLKGLRTVVTVPNIDLLTQSRKDLEVMLGEPVGYLGGGGKNSDPRVVVAYDGFLKQYGTHPFVKDLAKSCQLLISDEIQMVTKKLFPFYRKCVNAYYRYSFSGSLFDNSQSRIFNNLSFFGDTITTVTDEDTIAEGRTVPPIFKFYEFPVMVPKGYDYITAYTEKIVLNEPLNAFFANLIKPAYDEGKTVLVMTQRVKHCAIFQEALRKIGIESEQYHGKINTKERLSRRASFKDGKIPVLVATAQTLGVGSNFPRVEVFANMGCGLSDDKTRQKYGRSFRSFTDKDSVLVIEPFISGHKWFVRHSKARITLARTYATGSVFYIPFNGDEHQII